MRAVAVLMLACWAVNTQGSPTVSRDASHPDGLVGITFRDFISNLNVFRNEPLPSPSSTHVAPLTTRSASMPFVLGRREDAREVAIVFGDQGHRRPTTTPPTTTTTTTTITEPSSSAPVKTQNDGAVLFPGRRRIGAPEDYECGLFRNTTSSECSLETGRMMYQGSCERLLARGQCDEGEWLIKVEDEAQCQPRPCPMRHVLYKEQCVDPTDVTVCSLGQMLYLNFDGKADCDCEPNFVYEPGSGSCYSQYEQGPCRFGNYLDFTSTCSVECVHNDCVLNGYVMNPDTNQCHRKMYDGFCDKGLQVFHPGNYTVECATIGVRNIFDVATLRSCPPGSRHDFLGKCRETFRLPSITSVPSLYNGCPSGYIKDPRGTCRRTHRLL